VLYKGDASEGDPTRRCVVSGAVVSLPRWIRSRRHAPARATCSFLDQVVPPTLILEVPSSLGPCVNDFASNTSSRNLRLLLEQGALLLFSSSLALASPPVCFARSPPAPDSAVSSGFEAPAANAR